MKYLCLILLVILCGCKGSDKTTTAAPTPTDTISTALQPYVQSFESIYNVSISFSVIFDTDSSTGGSGSFGTTVGLCRVYTSGRREVLVNKSWWNSQSDLNRKILVFHELGHCMFNRDHDFELDSSGNKICDSYDNASPPVCTTYRYRRVAGKPTSMMYPVINPIATYFGADQEQYLYELKHPKPQSWDTAALVAWDNAYASHTSLALADSDYALSNQETSYAMQADDESEDINHYEEATEPSHGNGPCVEFIDDTKSGESI